MLADHNPLLSALTNNLACVVLDSAGHFYHFGSLFTDLCGFSLHDLKGKHFATICRCENDNISYEQIWKDIASGKCWRGILHNEHKDKTIRTTDSTLIPVLNTDHSLNSVLSFYYDISESIRLKEASKKLLDVLNETGDIAKVGGWELDIETGTLFWTDQTFKILGVEKQQGQNPILPEGLALFVDEHIPLIDEAVKRGISEGKPYALELLAKTPAGVEKWVYTDGKPNFKDGKITSLSGTIQDINDRKLAEFALVDERKKNIQNAKFVAIGELSASIAHEINNPLGIISGYAELIRMKGANELDGPLNAILKSCERISYIVDNLRRYARGDNKGPKSRLDLNSICRAALSLVMPKAKTNQVKLISSLSDGDCDICGNEIELEQVIINLINNSIDAVKSSNDGWIAMTVEKKSKHVLLSVEDSGTGIDNVVQERMFEPYFSTKDILSGTGLGLSIVKTILDDHNANIFVDSDCPNTRIVVKFDLYKENFYG